MRRHALTNDGQIIRKLYGSSVVSIIIAAIAAMFGMLIDGIVIGKFLGTDSMAAYGLVTPLFNIITAISGVLAAGSQVLCAKHLGAGRIDRAQQVFSACMAVTTVLAVLVMLAVAFFCGPMCIGLGAKGKAADLLPLTKGYLYGIAPGILPVLLLFIFNSLMRLDGDPDRVVWAVAAMTVVDIVGDLLNALVIHGGMVGMGVSTAISYYVALGILLLHFRKPDIVFHFSIKDLRWTDMMGIFHRGAPSAVGSIAAMIKILLLNLLMVRIAGNTAVAALSVRNTLNTLFGSILMGIGMTTTMIASMAYGEEDRSSEEHLMRVSLQYAIGYGLILMVLVLVGAPLFVKLFAGDSQGSEEMARMAVTAMRVYAIGLPFCGLADVFINYLQGIGRLKLANLLTALENLIFVVASAWILAPGLKTMAVWLSYPLGEGLTVLCVLLIAFHLRKKVPLHAADLLFLPDSFGAAPEETFERSMRTEAEAMQASRDVEAFMQSQGAPERTRRLISLFVEEMAMNVIEHGFKKDTKPHSVDLRVLRKDGSWIIRIRDNCRAFDPVKWLEIYRPKEPTANTGIRIVCEMASEVQYINAMQLNNLIIKV